MNAEGANLPEGWTSVRLADVILAVPNIKPEDEPGRVFRYVDISSIDNVRFAITETKAIRGEQAPSRARRPVQVGDVLFSNVRTYLRNIALVSEGVDADVCSTGFTVLRPSQAVLPDYLFRYVLTNDFIDLVTPEQTGTHYPATSDRVVTSQTIWLPPIEEQRRIVAAVERLVQKAESAREKLERVLKTMKLFRRAVLAAACSGRLTADWRENNPDSGRVEEFLRSLVAKPLAEGPANEELPTTWRWVRFGDVLGELRNGLSPKPNQNPPGTPILRINAVRPCEVAFDDLRYLECSDAQIRDYALRERDLLFTRYNGSLELLGVCGMVRDVEERVVVYPDKLMRVRFSTPEILPEYCEQFFSSPAARERMIANAKSSAGQNGVSGSDVKSQIFALPPVDEQREVVRRASALLNLADSIDQKAKATFRRVELLTQAVLTKAFRGELVPTEAELARKEGRSFEPATDLLKKVKVSSNEERKRPRGKKTSKRASSSGDGLLEFMEG